VQVKVCGITTRDDALLAAQVGTDFLGLVRAAGPRHVTLGAAELIAAALPPNVRPVLLFRNAPLHDVCTDLATSGLTWVQLHGAESAEYAHELLQVFPELNLIRAWEVSGPAAVTELRSYLQEAADEGVRFHAVILDAPKGGPHPGFDTLGAVSRQCRDLVDQFWLAGGLTCENLAPAVQAGDYAGVDVARGVESRPGIKNPQALQQFVGRARAL
jgi:phosphoribosylanthranilate isomerase